MRRWLLAIRERGRVRPPVTAHRGDLLVIVAGEHQYHRIVDGTEPPWFDASHAGEGISPAGRTPSPHLVGDISPDR